MLVRLALQVGVVVALATVTACGGASVTTPTDSGVQTCQDDQDCDLGFTCTGGYCQPTIPVDAGPDVPQSPKMLVSPTLLDFGNAYVGGEFTQTYTIANVGTAQLTITSQNLVEDRTVGAFIVQSKPVPFTIDVAATETITVILRPNDSNLPTGKIIIHSDDPDPTSGSATIDLISRSKGSADLGICVHTPTASACLESSPGNPIIDFGTVEYSTSVVRYVDLSNIGDGNLPLSITEISLTNPAHFLLGLYELIEDTAHPGQYLEQAATLPFLLSIGDPTATPPVPPTRLRVHVTFTAQGIVGNVPNESLLIKDLATPSPTSVPTTGTIHGCIPHATDAGVPDGGSDPLTDPHNCGTCGHVCVVAHGTAGCVNGNCTVAACDTGYADCNNNPGDGCEKNLRTDADNCGGCGKVCSNVNMLTRTCGDGTCNGTCQTGFKDCNTNKLTDGCESESASDPDNCSNCGVVCSANHMATRTCSGGVCNGTCAANFDNCDTNLQTNGCETDLLNDTTHCGTCSTDCTSGLAAKHVSSANCQNGGCHVVDCVNGYWDINGTFNDGCECNAADTVANTCGSAAQGSAPISWSGNLMPVGDEDWYRVTFSTGSSCIYPKVWLPSADPSVRMDVYSNCPATSPTACAGGESSIGVTTWEIAYSGCGDKLTRDPVPDQGTYWQLPLTYWVRVYATGTATTCRPYQLQVAQ